MAAGLAICPSLDATLLDAEDEHRAALNHGATLELVQTASDAGYHAAPCGLYEAECVGGGVDVAAEWAGGGGVRVGHGGDVVRFATSRGLALITGVDKTGSKEDDACMANLLACVLSYDQRHLEISAPTNEKGRWQSPGKRARPAQDNGITILGSGLQEFTHACAPWRAGPGASRPRRSRASMRPLSITLLASTTARAFDGRTAAASRSRRTRDGPPAQLPCDRRRGAVLIAAAVVEPRMVAALVAGAKFAPRPWAR